jgi:hypothetical protein
MDFPIRTVDQALTAEGSAIVDCVVPADELPDVPHIDLEKTENFAKAGCQLLLRRIGQTLENVECA